MKLGVYMRMIGEALTHRVETPKEVSTKIGRISESYTKKTLDKLVKQEIANKLSDGYVRGEKWNEAATKYSWGKAVQLELKLPAVDQED